MQAGAKLLIQQWSTRIELDQADQQRQDERE
jgi:hypothetical protein